MGVCIGSAAETGGAPPAASAAIVPWMQFLRLIVDISVRLPVSDSHPHHAGSRERMQLSLLQAPFTPGEYSLRNVAGRMLLAPTRLDSPMSKGH
jgi:hypothetical protein